MGTTTNPKTPGINAENAGVQTLRELLEREQTQRRDAESRAAELHAELPCETGVTLGHKWSK